jgi:hypothetical protein
MAISKFKHSMNGVKALTAAALLTTCLVAPAGADDPGEGLMAATRYCLNDKLRNWPFPKDGDIVQSLEWRKGVESVFLNCDVRLSEREDAQAYVTSLAKHRSGGLTIIEAPPPTRYVSSVDAPAFIAPTAGHFAGPAEIPLCVAPNRMTRDGCQPKGYRP